jgi:c-di-GMP-related signal transduction protein
MTACRLQTPNGKKPPDRAMFRELIGKKIQMHQDTNELFLIGLPSMRSALQNMPMLNVPKEIPFDEESRKPCLARQVDTGRFSKSCSTMNPAMGAVG